MSIVSLSGSAYTSFMLFLYLKIHWGFDLFDFSFSVYVVQQYFCMFQSLLMMGLVSHIPHQEFLQLFPTILPLHHLHTSMLACTQNMYQFCFKRDSNDSIFTDILINNTSRYAFMYHYCYFSSSSFTYRIIHCMITTSWFHLVFSLQFIDTLNK